MAANQQHQPHHLPQQQQQQQQNRPQRQHTNYDQYPAGYPPYGSRGPYVQPTNMPTPPPQVNNTNLQGHLYIDINQILHQASFMSYESGRLQSENTFLKRNQKESSSSDSASSPPRKKKPRSKQDDDRSKAPSASSAHPPPPTTPTQTEQQRAEATTRPKSAPSTRLVPNPESRDTHEPAAAQPPAPAAPGENVALHHIRQEIADFHEHYITTTNQKPTVHKINDAIDFWERLLRDTLNKRSRRINDTKRAGDEQYRAWYESSESIKLEERLTYAKHMLALWKLHLDPTADITLPPATMAHNQRLPRSQAQPPRRARSRRPKQPTRHDNSRQRCHNKRSHYDSLPAWNDGGPGTKRLGTSTTERAAFTQDGRNLYDPLAADGRRRREPQSFPHAIGADPSQLHGVWSEDRDPSRARSSPASKRSIPPGSKADATDRPERRSQSRPPLNAPRTPQSTDTPDAAMPDRSQPPETTTSTKQEKDADGSTPAATHSPRSSADYSGSDLD